MWRFIKIPALALLAVILITFAACSNGDNNTDTEVARLQAELEALQTQINTTAQVTTPKEETPSIVPETSDAKPDTSNAQTDYLALRETMAAQPETWVSQTFTATEQTIVGTWYVYSVGGQVDPNRNLSGLILNADGSASVVRRTWGTDAQDLIGDAIMTWHLDGNVIRVDWPDNTGAPVEFTFANGELSRDIDSVIGVYRKERPPTPEWHETQLGKTLTAAQITGEWYLWYYINNGVRTSVAESPDRLGVVFHLDGSLNEISTTYPNNMNYTIKGDTEQWHIEDGFVRRTFRDYRPDDYYLKGDELHLIHESGGVNVYKREKLQLTPELAADVAEYARENAGRQALAERFLGEWYYDVAKYIFLEDFTGYIDIPAFGGEPAGQFTFDWEVFESDTADAMLVFRWTGGRPDDRNEGYSSIYHCTFGDRSGGSMIKEPIASQGGQTILLTRMFDVNNTPFMDYVVEQAVGLLSTMDTILSLGGGGGLGDLIGSSGEGFESSNQFTGGDVQFIPGREVGIFEP